MERFSCRDRPLLGYSSPHRSIQNPSSSPKVPFRNSDVDFNDVFGGPPRRSSRNDMRHSFGNTLDTYASGGSEEALTSRSPWSALNEKPVFGEEVPIRRRYPSEDFFDDIFRGDEPSSFSPRKSGMDPFSSTPASRILSPVRPLPPKSEPFGPSSLPAHFSLPPKLAKGTDFPTLNASTSRSPHRNEDDASNGSFPSSPSAFTSRILNQSTQRQDGLRNDARLSYRRSLLSNEFSLSSEGSSKSTKSDKEDSGVTLKKDSISSETHNNGNQFHFSIYKWAGKSVPLVMPLRGGNSSSSKERGNNVRSLSSKERGKNVSTVSEFSASVLQSVEFPFFNDRLSPVNSSFHMECENQGYSSVINTVNEDRIDSFRFAQEAAPAKPDSKPLNSLQSIITEVPRGHAIRSGGKETNPFSDVSGSLHDVDLSMKPEKEMHVSMIEARKTELKPLCSLFYDNSDGQGKDEKAGQARRKEGKVEQITASYGNNDDVKNEEKKDGTRSILDVATSTSLQGSPVNSGDKPVRGKIKGKVKEFVKLFNQEAPLKPIINFDTRGHSSRWKDVDACKAEDEAGVCATKADEKENMTNLNKDKTLTDTYAMVDQTVKQPEKPQFVVNTIQKTYDTSSEEPIPASFEATLANVEEFHCEDLQGDCLVEELSHDPNKHQQTVDHHKEIQISDARIQQWSNGKETNIRSLLSTLQYVLWPESGWKPVALVDIVEGNAVKRAYQKALLCLHPDKLQQKGAASHQKYIAEKVFDILQEAWTHFNSLSSF